MAKQTELAQSRLFQGIATQDLEPIMRCGEELRCDNEEIIYEDSGYSSDLYVLLDGRVSVEVDVSHLSKDGRDRIQLAVLTPGDVFGDIAFLEGKRRSAAVRAIEAARMFRLDGTKLHHLFMTQPSMGYTVMRNLALILAQRIADFNFMWRDEIRRFP
jgi:CRP-like cAMP-binding protein